MNLWICSVILWVSSVVNGLVGQKMEVKHNCSECVHRKDVLVPCDWLKTQTVFIRDCPHYKKEGEDDGK
jgi:hypothetical protein